MPPKKAPPFPFTVVDEHAVDLDSFYYAADKAALLHLPGGSAIAKGQMDTARCFVLEKPTSLKVEAAPSTWIVRNMPFAITLPKLIEFIDEREKCVAVFWRTTDRDGEPWVVCLRPPFDPEKPHSDSDFCAVKLNQVKSFSPIKNESGGSMLSYMNKFCKESSAVLKQQKLGSVGAVLSFAAKDNSKMFLASKMVALTELELRIRRSQKTRRAGEKEPVARAAQEDNEAELAKCKEELKLLEALKEDLEQMVQILELPLTKRFFTLDDKTTWKDALIDQCAAQIHHPHACHSHALRYADPANEMTA